MTKDKDAIFRGDNSRALWDEINSLDELSTGADIRDCIYSVCCKLQELEHKFDRELKALYGGWVSVEDRLPEDEYQILIGCFYQKSQEIVVGTYHINHNLFYYDNDEFIAGVTHWQPLPEPPNPS